MVSTSPFPGKVDGRVDFYLADTTSSGEEKMGDGSLLGELSLYWVTVSTTHSADALICLSAASFFLCERRRLCLCGAKRSAACKASEVSAGGCCSQQDQSF